MARARNVMAPGAARPEFHDLAGFPEKSRRSVEPCSQAAPYNACVGHAGDAKSSSAAHVSMGDVMENTEPRERGRLRSLARISEVVDREWLPVAHVEALGGRRVHGGA